jgi:sugar transferase (PEP-CTERM system associated)
MTERFSHRTLALLTADFAILYSAILLALYLRTGSEGSAFQLYENNGWSKITLVTLVCMVSLYVYDLYDYLVLDNRRELKLRLVQAIGTAWILLSVLFYLVPTWEIGRGTAIYAILISLCWLLAVRSGMHYLLGHPEFGERILIVGEGFVAIDSAKAALRRRDAGYRIAGFITDEFEEVERTLGGARNLGKISDLEKIVEEEKIDSIVIGVREQRGGFPVDALLRLRLAGNVSIEESPTFFERVTGRVNLDMLRPSWLIFSRHAQNTQIKIVSREILYRSLALVGMVVTAPIVLLTAVLIKLESDGPCLYRQERVGKNGRTFEVLKFRSMRVDAEEEGSPVWAAEQDDRTTRVGRIIRKIRVDEIPQFWNILKGDMSFIGPRPERPHFVSQLAEEIRFYEHRHLVAPGLTGWAQIKYPYGASVEDARKKLEYDLYYIKNHSLALDVVILLETVKTILFGRGAR